jgi:hypothetical protein
MKEHGGHENLRGSGRRSVIPYVHRRMRVVLQCSVQMWTSLSIDLREYVVYLGLLWLKAEQLQ